MNADNLRRLRDAVAAQGREVQVDSSGQVREVNAAAEPRDKVGQQHESKPTKLAPRTFGR